MILEFSRGMVAYLIQAEGAPDAQGVRDVIDEVSRTWLGYNADQSGPSDFMDVLEVIEQEKAGVLEPAIPDMRPLLHKRTACDEVPF